MTEETTIRYSFTQPACEPCYADRYPGREPVRLREPEGETCCICGTRTKAGIYVRIDPKSVAFPTRTK